MISCDIGNYTMEIGQIVKHSKPADRTAIFDFEYPFYDEDHREEFENKFILHFRYNEIGQETLQRFKYMLQDVLTTEYPKYEHYYKTWLVAKDLRWQYNKDYYEENTRELNTQDNSTSNSNSSSNGQSGSRNVTEDITDSTSKFSDTPQGKIENLDDGYLTNYTKDRNEDVITSETNSSDSNSSNSNNSSSRTGKDVETTLNKQYGNIGVTSSGDLVESWNKVAVWFNIDKIIFDDCEQLFMGIY